MWITFRLENGLESIWYNKPIIEILPVETTLLLGARLKVKHYLSLNINHGLIMPNSLKVDQLFRCR